MTEQNFEEKNLVALIFASNTCYTNVVELSEVSGKRVHDPEDGWWNWAKVELNLAKGTWKHGRKHGSIGGSCRYDDGGSKNGYGLIGIYDRTNLKHLDSMCHAAKDATTGDRGGWD